VGELPQHHRLGYRAREFTRRLVDKSLEDHVFFMAGAIAFNVLVALLPLAILGIGLAGYVLSARFGNPTDAVVALIVENLPDAGAGVDLRGALAGPVSVLVEQRSGFTFFGAILFVWLATRLSGTLQVSLREVFDVAQERGLLRGKLFDVQMVLVGVLLLTLNLGITALVAGGGERGMQVLGLTGSARSLARVALGSGLAFASIWTLFLIVYRYVPARRIPWRTALVAASASAILHEGLKHAFSWYAVHVADYGSTFGNLATVVVLVVWIYYGSVVFILGGEVAQVYTMRSASRIRVVPAPAAVRTG
jgi:membrane protein